MITGDRALQPGCDAEPRFRGVRYSTGGLQPALAVRRLSSATTPGVERDGQSMRAPECAGITLTAHSVAMVNVHTSPSPRPYGERVGVRGSKQSPEQAAAPHPGPLPTEEWGEGNPSRKHVAAEREPCGPAGQHSNRHDAEYGKALVGRDGQYHQHEQRNCSAQLHPDDQVIGKTQEPGKRHFIGAFENSHRGQASRGPPLSAKAETAAALRARPPTPAAAA